MATAGFHLFASLPDVQGSRSPQLNTSCTLVREQPTFAARLQELSAGEICSENHLNIQSTSPNPPSVPCTAHDSGAEEHIYPCQPQPDVCSLSSRAKFQALCSLGVTPPLVQHSHHQVHAMGWVRNQI